MGKYRGVLNLLIAIVMLLTSCTPSAKFLREKNLSGEFDNNYVRVLIGVQEQPFRIKSESGLKVIFGENGKLLYETKKGGLVFYPEKINEVLIVESGNTPLFLNDKGYRGRLELHNVLGKVNIV